MGIPVSESRPSSFSNWGDGNPTPSTSIVEPPGGLQQTGWVPSQKPLPQYMNWIHWITNRWTKNLDVRAPRIPLYKWFVGEQSGAHFATLAAALASSSVSDGDWIYFSPSTANTTLTTAVTVAKSVKIFCEPGTEFTGSDTRAFIISANDVELHGAGFDDSWDGAGDTVIEITGARARVIRCNFDPGNTRYVDADAVADADKPVLSQNFPHVIDPDRVVDLWEWETGRHETTSIAASTNDLQWSTTFISSPNSHSSALPATLTIGRYQELLNMFGRGISLKIIDGAGAVWIIKPIAGATWTTYMSLGGTVGSSNYTFTLLATGVGVAFEVFKDGASVANFSTFTTLASGSMDDDSFRAIIYGDETFMTATGGFLTAANRPKRFWYRPLSGDPFAEFASSDVSAFRMKLEAGKAYRVSIFGASDGTVAANVLSLYNHFSTADQSTNVLNFVRPSQSVGTGFSISHAFVALGEDIMFKTSVSFYWDTNGLGVVPSNDVIYLNDRIVPNIVVEEL